MSREVLSVGITPESKKKLDKVCEQTGISKVVLVGKLLNWFTRQPKDLQAVITGAVSSPGAIVLLRAQADRIEQDPGATYQSPAAPAQLDKASMERVVKAVTQEMLKKKK